MHRSIRLLLVILIMWGGIALTGDSWLRAADSATIGMFAPKFKLMNQDGKTVRLADFAGKIVVLEWMNPNCPFVQRHYKAGTMVKLAKEFAGRDVVWLAVNSTHTSTAADDRAWIKTYNLPYPILDDHAGTVGKLYGARTTPHMFIIDRVGILVYAGAIDDDPQGSQATPTNYVRQVLTALLTGKSIPVKETKSYGCSVKYAE
jgi:peroxiredoxin